MERRLESVFSFITSFFTASCFIGFLIVFADFTCSASTKSMSMGSLFAIRVTKKIGLLRFKSLEICGPRTFLGYNLGTKEEQKAKIRFSFLCQKKRLTSRKWLTDLFLKAADL